MEKGSAFYRVEYQFIPTLVKAYLEQGLDARYFSDILVWKRLIFTQTPDVYEQFEWDDLKVTTYGRVGDDVMVVLYVFPEPVRSPLASYGVVVLKSGQAVYYTMELSFGDLYVLGSPSLEMHVNHGSLPAMSADDFLSVICQREAITLPAQQ